MTRIYLDDVRPCPPGWLLARSFDEFQHLVKGTEDGITAISFDHDLAPDHYSGSTSDLPTGYDAVKWLGEYAPQVLCRAAITCHSMNPVGKANILGHVAHIRRHHGDNR